MRISLARTLSKRAPSELMGLHDLWVGGPAPCDRPALIRALSRPMGEEGVVMAMRARLDPAADRVFHALLRHPGNTVHFDRIQTLASREGISASEVRSALAELVLLGLASNMSTRHDGETSSVWGAPRELAAAAKAALLRDGPPRGLLTLEGWLEAHFQERLGAEAGVTQARRMAPLLVAESSIRARLGELAEPVQRAVRVLAVDHGGILPVREMPEAIPGIEAVALREALEEATLGTLGELDLEPFRIRQRGQVICLFHQVLQVCLQDEAERNPSLPAATATIGVDFVSNFDRFANFVDDETVRFTVRGTIYKSTGKRLADRLIPNPGREFGRLEILEMEYRFALAYRLIDRTGERSFRVTKAGKEFLRLPLVEKQRTMLDCLSEDRDMPGDVMHQLELRRLALRYLGMLQPGRWYDAMTLPFLARSDYLGHLRIEDENGCDQASFPLRSSADLRSLAWNLFTWVRKHLYLLGFIDMGYEENGRACSIRLTPMGAEFLGVLPAAELDAAGHLVVNPDFEVVLFPEAQSHELVYSLDRFADREKSDSLFHFRITPASLHRALSEGSDLDDILRLLRERSRTPLPQNVEYSLESWARRDGLVTYSAEPATLECESPEILDRIALHPELGRLGIERVDRHTLRILGKVEIAPLSEWVRDYGVTFRQAS